MFLQIGHPQTIGVLTKQNWFRGVWGWIRPLGASSKKGKGSLKALQRVRLRGSDPDQAAQALSKNPMDVRSKIWYNTSSKRWSFPQIAPQKMDRVVLENPSKGWFVCLYIYNIIYIYIYIKYNIYIFIYIYIYTYFIVFVSPPWDGWPAGNSEDLRGVHSVGGGPVGVANLGDSGLRRGGHGLHMRCFEGDASYRV